ncbi:MAG: PDZ domain-containing protein, partial [Gemmatimonadaceae bacterium]
MSRSTAHAPLLLTVTLALAAVAVPLAAQRPEAPVRRTVRVTVSDSSERQLRRMARTIDSLVRAFEAGDLSAAERFRIGRTIDALTAQFNAERMQLAGPGSAVKIEGPYVARAPEAPVGPSTWVDMTRTFTTSTPPAMARGWIGIVVSGAPREMRTEGNELMMRFLSYPEIVSVDPSSPAQRAGLTPGDTLLAYDGQDVRGADISMTKLLRPSARITVRVRRDGRVKELPLVVAEAPSRIMIRRGDELRGAGQSWVYTTPPDVAPNPVLAPAAPTVPRTPMPTLPPAFATRPAPVIMPLPRPFELSPSGVAGAQMATISEDMKGSLGIQSGVLVTMVPVGTP